MGSKPHAHCDPLLLESPMDLEYGKEVTISCLQPSTHTYRYAPSAEQSIGILVQAKSEGPSWGLWRVC